MIEIGNPRQADGIAYLGGRRVFSSGAEPAGPNLTRLGMLAEAMPAMIDAPKLVSLTFPTASISRPRNGNSARNAPGR